MKAIIMVMILAFIAVPLLWANGQGTAYHVVRTEDIKKAIPEGGDVSDIDSAKLSELSIAHGYYVGSLCNLYLKTKEYQFRIKAYGTFAISKNNAVKLHPGDRTVEYSLSMFSQKSRKSVFRCSGTVNVSEGPSARKGWEKGEFVVVFSRVAFRE